MNEQFSENKKNSGTKKRVVIMPVIGLIIGLALIVTGIVKTNTLERNAQAEIPVLEAELETLEYQEFELEKQKTNVFLDGGFSDEYYELAKQLEDIREEITDIESRLRSLGNLSFEKSKNIPFFMFGTFIIIASLISGVVLLAAAKALSAMPNIVDTIKQAGTTAANAPTATSCPQCGATTLPDANGRCEYCGGAVWSGRRK